MKHLFTIFCLLVFCPIFPSEVSAQSSPIVGYVTSVKWNVDNTKFGITTSGGAWIFVDNTLFQITVDHIDDIAWSPDGTQIAILRRLSNASVFGTIEIWQVSNPASPQLLRSFVDEDLAGEDIQQLEWNPVSSLLAVSGKGIRIWNAITGLLVITLQQGEITGEIEWSPDGTKLASFTGGPKIWDIATEDLVYDEQLPIPANFGSWGSDSQHIAVVQSSPVVYVYEVQILDMSVLGANPVIFPMTSVTTIIDWKGNTLAAFVDNGVQLWDVPSKAAITAIPSLGNSDFALSPNGSQMGYLHDGAIEIQRVNNSLLSSPSNLANTLLSANQIGLTWAYTSTNETNFLIERSPNGTTDWTQIATIPTGTTSYTDENLDASTTYYYRVRAYRSSDNQYSEYSNIAKVLTSSTAP